MSDIRKLVFLIWEHSEPDNVYDAIEDAIYWLKDRDYIQVNEILQDNGFDG